MTPPTIVPVLSLPGAPAPTGLGRLDVPADGTAAVSDVEDDDEDEEEDDEEDVVRRVVVALPMVECERVEVMPVAEALTVVARLLAVPHPYCEKPPSNSFL